MKNLFNDISQDEKNRILEMHSAKKNIISEQGIQQIPDFGAETLLSGQRPVPKPSPKPTPISLEGKTVNLYRDANETDITGKFKLLKPKGDGESLTIPIDPEGKVGGVVQKIFFMCSHINNKPKMELIQKFPRVAQTQTSEVFNLKFLNELKRQYCAVSRGGNSTPKADFAMNNQSTDTITGIA